MKEYGVVADTWSYFRHSVKVNAAVNKNKGRSSNQTQNSLTVMTSIFLFMLISGKTDTKLTLVIESISGEVQPFSRSDILNILHCLFLQFSFI